MTVAVRGNTSRMQKGGAPAARFLHQYGNLLRRTWRVTAGGLVAVAIAAVLLVSYADYPADAVAFGFATWVVIKFVGLALAVPFMRSIDDGAGERG